MLADSFIKAHAEARKVHARKTDIFRFTQGESELLREIVTRFQKERMLLSAIPDEWAAEAFTKGLNPRSSDASQKLKESDHLQYLQKTFDILRKYNMKLNPEKCAFGVSSGKFLGFLVSRRGIEVNPDKIKAIEDIPDQLSNVKEVQRLTGILTASSRFISRS
uniref:Reverse transcriptase/retrotransposon-derived protein RNase H-like domain-containing protein n=1 Tax=Nicotiana tabacum TaxID=4097 RepID=A0A1S3XDK8_TOBAC|nr:PREDICTED: uncharacterized protein LOC107763869 [Nicotiana tabacum]